MSDTKNAATYNVIVPQQSVELLALTDLQLMDWVGKERAFFVQQNQIAQTPLIMSGQNYGPSRQVGQFQTDIDNLKGLLSSQASPEVIQEVLEQILAPAKNLRRILSDSAIGMHLKSSTSEENMKSLHQVLLIFSDDFSSNHPTAAAAIFTQRIVINGYASTSTQKVAEAYSASSIAEKAQRLSIEKLTELQNLETLQSTRLTELHSLYHSKLALEAPTAVWSAIYEDKTKSWRLWLTAFAIAILIPLIVLFIYRVSVVDTLHTLTKDNGNFSVTGLAAITAPVLLYTWLLRQLSKLFVRSLDLATDSAHRKALTQTFLGLAENAKSGVSQAERAIILQALFRPQPPHMSDDGPPMSLVELLKKE